MMILSILNAIIDLRATWQEVSGTQWSPLWQGREGKSWSKRKLEMFNGWELADATLERFDTPVGLLVAWVLFSSILTTFVSGCISTEKTITFSVNYFWDNCQEEELENFKNLVSSVCPSIFSCEWTSVLAACKSINVEYSTKFRPSKIIDW